MAKLLGIDVGTSACKAVLIDEYGAVLKQASAEYPLEVPQPLWSQQNPEDWWNGVQACLAQIGESRPDAIGLTGQMHGAVFLDEKDEVVYPAILWNDQRTAAECAQMDAAVGTERMMQITCNPPLTGFQAPKLLWLRNHEPEKYRSVRSLLLPKDYIRLRLSGEKATEVSDASGTALFDVPNRRWSDEILSKLDVDPAILPKSYESTAISSRTRAGGHLEAGIPIAGGGGDQAAGAAGTGAVVPGVVSVSLGTSGVVFTALSEPRYDSAGAAHTFCHANNAWHAMGVMLSCGGAIRWLRDALYPGESYDAMNLEASRISAGADGLCFLPYLTGERTPHKDPNARGAWVGLTLAHGRAEMARAVFEGVTFGLRDGFECLKALGAQSDEVRVTGGGAKSRLWMQMLADVFSARCVAIEADEGPAFGAALIAGVGVGLWPNLEGACRDCVRTGQPVAPSGAPYEAEYRRYRDLYPRLKEWFAE